MAAEYELQERYFQHAGAVAKTVYNAVMQGGEVQAAFRQGIGELGAALKAFPDTIQHDEPGAVFDPLYRDIPSASKPGVPSPSDIADGITPARQQGGVQGPERGVYEPEHGVYDRDNGMQASHSTDNGKPDPLPSPGDIADGKGPQPQEEKDWRQRMNEERQGNQDGNADTDQSEQARGRSLPEEQQDKGRGRGR